MTTAILSFQFLRFRLCLDESEASAKRRLNSEGPGRGRQPHKTQHLSIAEIEPLGKSNPPRQEENSALNPLAELHTPGKTSPPKPCPVSPHQNLNQKCAETSSARAAAHGRC